MQSVRSNPPKEHWRMFSPVRMAMVAAWLQACCACVPAQAPSPGAAIAVALDVRHEFFPSAAVGEGFGLAPREMPDPSPALGEAMRVRAHGSRIRCPDS